MTPSRKRYLLSSETSRRNKMHLLADSIARGDIVEWKWAGVSYNSRLMIRIDGGEWLVCKSFDEDILTKYRGGKEK